MKRVIRIICCILVLSFLFVAPVAAEDQGTRASSFFIATRTSLEKTGATSLEVWFEVTAKRTMDKLGVSDIVIQRSADGSTWYTVRHCVSNNYPHLIRENTVIHCDYLSHNATGGNYYRAKVTYYAEDSTGTGVYTTWTSTVWVPRT